MNSLGNFNSLFQTHLQPPLSLNSNEEVNEIFSFMFFNVTMDDFFFRSTLMNLFPAVALIALIIFFGYAEEIVLNGTLSEKNLHSLHP